MVPDTVLSGRLDLEPVPPVSDEPVGEVPEKLIETAGVADRLPPTEGEDVRLAIGDSKAPMGVGDQLPLTVAAVADERAGRSPKELVVHVLPSEVSAAHGIVGLAVQVSAVEDGTSVELEFVRFTLFDGHLP